MEKIIVDALKRFNQVLDSLDCECDSYNGYVCTFHSDKELVESALKSCKSKGEG